MTETIRGDVMVLFSNAPNIPEDYNFLWCVGTWEIKEIFKHLIRTTEFIT